VTFAQQKYPNSTNTEHRLQTQGCQMVYFQTKNPNLGKFWRSLEWKMLVYFKVIWNILRPFGNVVVIFPYFGTLCQEKSGNHVQAMSGRFCSICYFLLINNL
jgi:hypothetical protein